MAQVKSILLVGVGGQGTILVSKILTAGLLKAGYDVNRLEAGKKLVKTPMVYWSVDPEDWKVLDADKVSEHVCSHVQDGDIILLHDFYPTSVEAALRIVDRLQEEGYEFVTVEELLRLNGTKAEAGKLYRNAWEERL